MKTKKNILFMALLAMFSTPTKPIDPLTIAALASAVAVGSVIYAYTPYTCTKCHLFINNASDCVVNSECGRHTFHAYCYDSRVRCMGCVKEEREYAQQEQIKRDETIRENERQRIARQQAKDREVEVQQLRRDEEARQAREHQIRLQEKARKTEQAWQSKQDEKKAQELAQEESRKARGGYVTADQAKRDQEEEQGYRTAVGVAREEAIALHEKQRFEREQALIRSNEGMMKICTICCCPCAQRDENSEVLIDLRKYPKHVTALPCGDVYHTACIKKYSEYGTQCPNCRSSFNPKDL